MSVTGINAADFYREVTSNGRVWTIRDAGGFPAPQGDGGRAMPFWSSRGRVERVIARVPAYRAFDPFEIDLAAFIGRWLPGLERDGLKVGVNWSGDRAMGYDVEPNTVLAALTAATERQDDSSSS